MIIFNILLFLLLGSVLFLMVVGFITGWNGYSEENGFSDFVNSNRWMDNK